MAYFTESLGHDSVRPIPKSERSMKFFSTFALWLAANVVVTTVFTGMLMVPDLKFTTVLLVAAVGSLVGSIPVVLIGNMGTRTGLPTMILTRGAFGHRGSVLPAAVNTIVLIGWSWIQAYMGGLSLDHAVKYLTGYSNINLFVIITEVLVLIITIYGHRGIEKTENVVAVLMLILSAIVFSYMFIKFDVSNLITMAVEDHPSMTTMVGFDIVVSTAFSWMTSSCDYNRNIRSEKSGMLGTWLGYAVGTILAMGLGAAVAGFSLLGGHEKIYDPTDLIGGINPALGFFAGIVIFLSVLSTNVLALYSATMSFLAIFPKRRFIGPVIVIGILAISGALLKGWLLTHFQDFLLMVGTLFIPVSAIMVIDYYFLKRKHYDAEEIVSGDRKSYWYNGGVNYWSNVSYIVGAVFAYYFTYVHPLSTGATIWTFVVTAVVYWGLMKTVGFQSSQKNSEMDRSAVGESYKATKTELGVKK